MPGLLVHIPQPQAPSFLLDSRWAQSCNPSTHSLMKSMLLFCSYFLTLFLSNFSVFTFGYQFFLFLEFNQERSVGLRFLQSGVWTSRALPWLPCTGSTWVTTPSWLPLPEQFLSAPLGLGNSQVLSFTLHSDSVSVAVANRPKM